MGVARVALDHAHPKRRVCQRRVVGDRRTHDAATHHENVVLMRDGAAQADRGYTPQRRHGRSPHQAGGVRPERGGGHFQRTTRRPTTRVQSKDRSLANLAAASATCQPAASVRRSQARRAHVGGNAAWTWTLICLSVLFNKFSRLLTYSGTSQSRRAESPRSPAKAPSWGRSFAEQPSQG